LIALAAAIWFLLSHFNPALLLLKTTIAGGDTCAHNYLVGYMRDYLLPNLKLSGWSPGWWAGFPMFQYYFFMPYLLAALLSYLIPLEIAFKLVSVSGVFALPIVSYVALRHMRLAFPVPALGSLASLFLLFHERQTIWGINIPSTLAGEISVSISFSAMVLFLGLLYKHAEERRFSMALPLLFSFVVFTHLTTALVAGVTSLFFLMARDRETFKRNLMLLAKTYFVAFLLTAFWTLPIVAKWEYSVGFGEEWSIDALSLYPDAALAAFAFAAYGIAASLWRRERAVHYLLFSALSSLVLFQFAYSIYLVNIRFWPFHYYYLFILGCYGLAALVDGVFRVLTSKAGFSWLRRFAARSLPLLLALAVFTHLNASLTFTDAWIYGNYEGYESKMAWEDYKGIADLLEGTPGRAANDLSEKNVPFSSSRAFEALPYFNGKPVIEGGIVQSGLSSLFTYYIQCESSKQCAGFPRIMTPTTFNFTRATDHLRLYNVKHFIAVEPQVKDALRNSPEWSLAGRFGEHEVYELTSNDGSYVYVPEYMPVLSSDEGWKFLAMRWFEDTGNIETPIAFTGDITPGDSVRFAGVYSDNSALWSALASRQSEYLGEWLLCGPFPNPRTQPLTQDNVWDPSLDYGLDVDYIGESSASPVEGSSCGGSRAWTPGYAHESGFVDLYTAYEPDAEGVVSYAASYVYSPDDRVVDLLYGSDDGVKIWVNGMLVEENHVHRGTVGVSDRVGLRLNAGWNLLLVKVENVVSSWGFYAKLAGEDGAALGDLRGSNSPSSKKESADLRAEKISGKCSISESVGNEEINFTTDCPGKPHIIKVSYFPNWRVEGADKVYLVTPSFMLVYPDSTRVRLYYGSTAVDYLGVGLTFLGLLTVVFNFIRRRKHGRRK